MSGQGSYWTRKLISRRDALRGAAVIGGGAAALSLIACGNDDKPAGSSQGTSEAVDWTKGIQGGVLNIQANNFPASLNLVQSAGATSRFAGPTHSGLLNFKSGRSGLDPASLDVEPDAAQALPEQPNELTQIYKLRPGIKFHNGRTMTAEDVKYSLDSLAADRSAYKDQYTWFDKIEATDDLTVTIKTKAPFADALQSVALYQGPYILAKEHQESPAVNERMMGSGPFIMTGATSPVSVSYKRNPDYFLKPLPYFDEVVFHVITDAPLQVSQFTTKQVQMTWHNPPETRDQIKPARPDARSWVFQKEGQCVWLRCDQAPFSDKRVRQALSMTVDRKLLRDGAYQGEGEDDQAFSIAHSYWGFRKPSQLKSAKYWAYDPAEAKKLLAAAGVDKPIETPMSVSTGAANQVITDQATLTQARWRDLGVANVRNIPLMNAPFQSGPGAGNYEGMASFNNSQQGVLGNFLYGVYWSPPEGVKIPTKNVGHINDQPMSRLLEKQLTQFNIEERKSTFREIEEIFGEAQYRLIFSTYFSTWFADPSLRNAEMFKFTNQCCSWYIKYWWFDKA